MSCFVSPNMVSILWGQDLNDSFCIPTMFQAFWMVDVLKLPPGLERQWARVGVVSGARQS